MNTTSVEVTAGLGGERLAVSSGRTALRFSSPEYQASKHTHAGQKPRAWAAASMSRNRSFLVRLGTSAGSTSR